MVRAIDRRAFVTLMAKIIGSGTALSLSDPVINAALAQQAKDEVNVGWLRLACTAQSFVGGSAGHGDWVQLVMRHQLFNAGAETIEALGAGALDASYLGTTPAIAGITQGLPTKIYAGGHKRGMGLVVPGNSPIKSVKDLKGRTIATLGRGSLPDMQLRVTVAAAGLNADTDFNLITLPSSDAVTALSKGSIDGLMNCPEWPQVALTTIPGSRFVLTDIDGSLWHGPETQCVVVIVKQKFANDNRRALKKLLEVHVKASRFILQEPEKASDMVAKLEGAAPAATRLAFSQMDISPVPSINSIVKWRNKLSEFGFLKRKAKIEELVDLGPLQEVLADSNETEWQEQLKREMALFKEIQSKEG